MNDVIVTDNVIKRYNTHQKEAAVQGLSISVAAGILFGLVGPDGAGKTTTLRMLSSVMLPSSGEIMVLGHNTRTQADLIRKQIGYMPQNFSLYPDLTVWENLSFFADIQQMPAARKSARMAEMLRFTRLEDFRGRRASALSGGMKKKLALACALVHEPKVLILDEPSTGVDPVSRRELWVILAEVVERGVTVVVSTPYMDEAERCHQVSFLFGGQVLAAGTPEHLKQQLPYDVVEVKASPRKNMRRIASELPEVVEWRPVGDSLRLTVRNNGTAERVLQQLDERLRAESMKVSVLRKTKVLMEDVFVHLVNQERGEK